MNQPHIVVIIVSYKTAQLTIESLRSVANERAATANLTITAIVVDNASGDSVEIAAAISANDWSAWATLITSSHNGGFGYGNNLGFKHALAQGHVDYFHLLNPDAQLQVGAFGHLVDFFKTNAKAGIAGSSFTNLDGSLWPIAFRFPSILGEVEHGMQLGVVTKLLKSHVIAVNMEQTTQPIDWVAGASMMIRSEVVTALKGFDESYFLYYEETDFCLRAKRLGFETWYVPTSSVMHIAGQSTKVTERNTTAKRLPKYWFESRARFYLSNYGATYAILMDCFTLLAQTVGLLKRTLLGKRKDNIPYFLTDLWRNAVFFAANRTVKPFSSLLE